MLRSLYILVIYFAIFGIGLGVPFVLTLGHIWVDIFRPQNVIYAGFQIVPLGLLMAVAAIVSYAILDRRAPPRIGGTIIVIVLFSLWSTATLLWAVVPAFAWAKWDWAFSSIVFSAFIPFVIRSRNQIEAFFQVYIFSLAANVIPLGVKALITGGGYKQFGRGLMGGNSFLGNGEMLCAAAISSIPIIFFLMKHGRIFPQSLLTRFGYIGLVALSFAAAIGTHERTGLVCLVVLAGTMFFATKRKFTFLLVAAMTAGVILYTAPASWFERMSTIQATDEGQRDSSSMTRLLMWKWTLDYATEHPLGGGFDAYRISRITTDIDDEQNVVRVQNGRAYHNSYFEVLGELGWPGLAMFVALFALSVIQLRQVGRLANGKPHLAWAADLSRAMQASLAVMLAGGSFVDMGFQPFFYYWFALAACLREYVRRVQEVPVAVEKRPAFALARS